MRRPHRRPSSFSCANSPRRCPEVIHDLSQRRLALTGRRRSRGTRADKGFAWPTSLPRGRLPAGQVSTDPGQSRGTMTLGRNPAPTSGPARANQAASATTSAARGLTPPRLATTTPRPDPHRLDRSWAHAKPTSDNRSITPRSCGRLRTLVPLCVRSPSPSAISVGRRGRTRSATPPQPSLGSPPGTCARWCTQRC